MSIEQFVRKGTRRSHLSPTWRRATSALMATAVTMGALGAWPTSASAAPPSPPSNPPSATPTPNPHALEHGLGLKLEIPEKLRTHPFHTPRKVDTVGVTAPTGAIGTAGTLPAQVDLSAGLPPVGNQGLEASCVAWSIGYYYEGFQEGQEHAWALGDPTHQFSPAFVYNQINGGVDGGSVPSDALGLLQMKGDASLASFPYAAGDYLTQPSPSQVQDALPYTTASWAWFFREDVAGMKAHLAAGDLVSISIPVYSNFISPSSPCTTPIEIPAAGWGDPSYQGGHQVTLVGYDDAKQAFKIVNSWGPLWGCSGFAWLSYDFVANRTDPYGRTTYYGYSMAGKADTLGLLTGKVLDSTTGAAIAGAQVTAGGYAIQTDASGAFTLAVPAGSLTVSVTATGYTAWSQPVQLAGGTPLSLAPVLTRTIQPQSQSQTTFLIDARTAGANGVFFDTGVVLQAGQSVQVAASGTASFEPGFSTSPDGFVQLPLACGVWGTCPDNFALRGSLVARVGSGPVQLVGNGPTVLTGTGTLQLAYNDVVPDFANNSGGRHRGIRPGRRPR